MAAKAKQAKKAKMEVTQSTGVQEISKADLNDYLEKGCLHIRVILEVLGASKTMKSEDYVTDLLVKLVEKMKKESDTIFTKEHFSKPKKQTKLYATYAELELIVKDVPSLIALCFDYLPSSVEIMEPEKMALQSSDLSGFLNDLQARLHKMDAIVKQGAANNKNLLRNTNLLLRNLIIITLTYKGPTKLDKLSQYIGVGKEQLESFLKEMINDEWIREEDGKYAAIKKK
tara:strand:- start:93 stop:779 length:687 start_codon:yes stop_codon:yes gene_type:complete